MTIREELDALNAGFSQDLAEQNVQGLVDRYTDDARMLFPGEPVIRGRTAIEAVMRAWVEDGPVNVRFETGDVIADGSLVVDIGQIIGATGSRTKYVVLYQRQPDGRLKIAVDAPSSEGAPPASE